MCRVSEQRSKPRPFEFAASGLRACLGIALAATLWLPGLTRGEGIVANKSLKPAAGSSKNLVVNPDLEEGDQAPLPSWAKWDLGYELDTQTFHKGGRSARCQSANPKEERGLAETITLNQDKPTPIIAECWSKAEKASGTPDSNYSLYLDLEFMDGTPLWGQTGSFSCGTHDWEKRRVVVVPDKPIKQVTIYGIFRGRTGTAWFDDYSLTELKLPEGAAQFDSVPVERTTIAAGPVSQPLTLRTAEGPVLTLDKATGQVVGKENRRGGFYLRDVATQSDFRQPLGEVREEKEGATWQAAEDELKLKLSATYKAVTGYDFPGIGRVIGGLFKRNRDHIRVDVTVEDLSKQDRAVTVYFALPLDAIGWCWSEDMRKDEVIASGKSYFRGVQVGAGATGQMSWYPLACLSGETEGWSIATPLDVPRLYRLSYNADSRELYAAFDFGLSPDTAKFPSKATFSFVLYRFDPQWRMRAALRKYYDIYPESFAKRVKKEGLWMPFTDIAAVPGFEDFGFAFQEGASNVGFDHEHGFRDFVYVEPMSHWLAMPPDAPRTYEGALEVLKKDLTGARGSGARNMAIATMTSGIYRSDGTYAMSIQKAPWCDGALFMLSPDPQIPTTPELPMTKAKAMLEGVEAAFKGKQAVAPNWASYGQGYEVDTQVKRSGNQSMRCAVKEQGLEIGTSQPVVLNQKEAKPLVVRAWSKAEGVAGERNNDYSIYVDLSYTDGTPQWGLTAEFSVGTHDWEKAERVIEPQKPVAMATVHLLFRRSHTGTAWFDDAFLGEVGSETNLLQNGGFEPGKTAVTGEPDGTYLDSYEMGFSELNYRRDHYRATNIPLVFDRTEYKPCQLMIFSTYEFEKEIAERMHRQGKLMFANAVLWQFAFPAHLLDVLGTEVNWLAAGKYQPDGDAIMNYRRAMCCRKPYCLLMNTNYEKFNHEMAERYMKRCLFYAVFPGFFDEEAASKDPYWTSPKKWYDRDRNLFKKFVPLIVSLAQAGWEPVTGARTDNATVYVERYGSTDRNNLCFTVFNDSSQVQTFRLTIELKALGVRSPFKIAEVLSNREVTCERQGDRAVVTGELTGEDVTVLKLTNP